jgi:hypothetical protein
MEQIEYLNNRKRNLFLLAFFTPSITSPSLSIFSESYAPVKIFTTYEYLFFLYPTII